MNQDKTRLIEFGRFAIGNYKKKNKGKPSTFDFLGFTHICSKKRDVNQFKLRRKTVAKKMKLKLLEIKLALRKRINLDVYSQGKWLQKILMGHYNYYAVPDNGIALDRCSQKSNVNWKKLTKLIRHFLPNAKILHPYPNQRFCV